MLIAKYICYIQKKVDMFQVVKIKLPLLAPLQKYC